MTRRELQDQVTPILNGLEDHADGMKPLTPARARELADALDQLADRLMHEGVVG